MSLKTFLASMNPFPGVPATVSVPAAVITAAGVGTLAYVGGKAALLTAGAVAGAVYGAVVVNAVAQQAVAGTIAASKGVREHLNKPKMQGGAVAVAG